MDWPPIDSQWTQPQLHSWVRQMGILPDPHEVIPQGVKFIAWPQPPATEREIEICRRLEREIKAGTRKPIAVIRRVRDPKRN